VSGTGFPSLPTSLPFREEALRRIAQAVNGLLQGKSNNVGTVTCTPGATTTVVTDSRIGANSTMPLDARSKFLRTPAGQLAFDKLDGFADDLIEVEPTFHTDVENGVLSHPVC